MEELVKRLRELHPEEFGDAWDFAFACQQAMHEAADAIEGLQKLLDGVSADNDSLCKQLDELSKARDAACWGCKCKKMEPPKEGE